MASRRIDYETAGLDLGDMLADPIEQWQRWYDQAATAGIEEPNAFVLGTVDADGYPQTRYLLARGADSAGFVFFTNYESAKSTEMGAHPKASMLFTWLQLHRQVRVVGTVQRVSDHDSDVYYASRPRSSQIGAWSSPQSQPLPDRAALEERVARFEATFAGVDEIPRPAYWGGWRMTPSMVEFWQGRPSRLHDRLRYTLSDAGWVIDRLAP
ncbi:MAG: pyridoxamine 5'-phosphate oxidase [Ilumatobacteraceae bacterium]